MTYPGLSIKSGVYLILMWIPAFLTRKHGVSSAYYQISFAMVLAFLGSLSTKKRASSCVYCFLIFLQLLLNKFDLFHLIALIGPLGAYLLLKLSKTIAYYTNADTNKMVCFRYFTLALGCLFSFAFG